MKVNTPPVDYIWPSGAAPVVNDMHRTNTNEPPCDDLLSHAISTLRRHKSCNDITINTKKTIDLIAEVKQYLNQQGVYNRAAAHDWLSDKPHAEIRRSELARIPGGEVIAAQYGLSITKYEEKKEDFSPRMRFEHEGSSGYHRMTPAASLIEKCYALYFAKHGRLPPHTGAAFVSTEYAAKALIGTMPAPSRGESNNFSKLSLRQRLDVRFYNRHSRKQKENQHYIQVAPGIFAVHYKAPYTSPEMDEKLTLIGARISPFNIEKALRERPQRGTHDTRIDNKILFSFFNKITESPLAQLASLPLEHAAAAQGGAVVSLIKDLQHVLEDSDALITHRHNPILANGLKALGQALQALPAQQHDNQRFSNAYIAVMEELQVVLSTSRPYSFFSYKAAAAAKTLDFLDPTVKAALHPLEPTAFLTTSGMNAIYQSLEAAHILSGKNEITILQNYAGKHSPPYFEAENLLRQNGTIFMPESSTIYATLNQSTLFHDNWGGGAEIAAALKLYLDQRKKDAPPLTFILDRTVERREDLSQLLKELAPALKSGKLCIFLCKSHQKFSSLGSAKISAGDITFLGADDETGTKAKRLLERNELELGWMADSELQLTTHFVRSGRHEHELFDKAVANSNFLRKECFSKLDHTPAKHHSEKLPFLQISLHDNAENKPRWPSFKIKPANPNEDYKLSIPPGAMFSQHLIHCRGSFGLPTTNFLPLYDFPGYEGTAFRFSIGQESKAELVEHFYMATRAMCLDQKTWDCEQACKHIDELIQESLPTENRHSTQRMKLSQKLALVAANEASQLNNEERMSGTLADMRAALKKNNENQNFTLNKIVSTIGLLETLADQYDLKLETTRERKQLDPLLAALIKSDMLGVSSLGRNHVFRLQARLCNADLRADNPKTRNRAVETLITTMEKASSARLYFMEKCLIPDAVMKEQPGVTREKLLNLLFKPLPRDAQISFLTRHKGKSEYKLFAEACALSLNTKIRSQPEHSFRPSP